MELVDYFVPFESGVPQALKNLGFDEPCFGIYAINTVITPGLPIEPGTLIMIGSTKKGYHHDDYIAAPLYNQVQTWLRDVHKINLEMYQADSGDYVYSLTTIDNQQLRLGQDGNYPYMDALLYGCQAAIDVIHRRLKLTVLWKEKLEEINAKQYEN